jgi:hypothetical protein
MKRHSNLLFFCAATIFGLGAAFLSRLPEYGRAMGDPTATYLTAFALLWMAAGVTVTAICHTCWSATRAWLVTGLISAPALALMGRYDGPVILALWTATVSAGWGIMTVLLLARMGDLAAPRRRGLKFAAILLGVLAGGAIGVAPAGGAAAAAEYAQLFDLLALIWLALVAAGVVALEPVRTVAEFSAGEPQESTRESQMKV